MNKKTQVYLLFGAGVACFVIDYFLPENTTAQVMTGWAVIVVGVICVVIAGKIAKGLKSERTAK